MVLYQSSFYINLEFDLILSIYMNLFRTKYYLYLLKKIKPKFAIYDNYLVFNKKIGLLLCPNSCVRHRQTSRNPKDV